MNIFYKYIKALDVLYIYIFTKKYSPTSINELLPPNWITCVHLKITHFLCLNNVEYNAYVKKDSIF